MQASAQSPPVDFAMGECQNIFLMHSNKRIINIMLLIIIINFLHIIYIYSNDNNNNNIIIII